MFTEKFNPEVCTVQKDSEQSWSYTAPPTILMAVHRMLQEQIKCSKEKNSLIIIPGYSSDSHDFYKVTKNRRPKFT